jgi:hypothetical protein
MYKEEMHYSTTGRNDILTLLLLMIGLTLVATYFNRFESYADPLILKIRKDLIDVDPRASRLSFAASDRSFTDNKTKVYLCLKDDDGNYYPYNMLMYVALHELAHAVSKSEDPDHVGKEFMENFDYLLKTAEQKGKYDPNIPLVMDYCHTPPPE